ncbi:MAG TPA: glycoside hydrolase family 2 TIM barrel-domain containing protein [Candidatus Limnocylindrales bacterium]|nr:glycoside hydrolase family 2 TIM barrel-domain containing protein [Candidatus Limnocylindrales bacterium]
MLRRTAGLLLAVAVLATPLAGCAPVAHPGSLPATLQMQDVAGQSVAMQNGIPVPTFDRQARRQLELSGTWRVQLARLSAELSLTDRGQALDAIVAEAGGREQLGYNDAGWAETRVPGALNRPPAGTEIGGWYRRSFYVSTTWRGMASTLKIGSANYIADVWVNGQYLGYHEGGYTPFAFDLSSVLRPGQRNWIAIRVDNPAWGTRNDIVPWGLADWWNYGGLTGPVWIEATPASHLVRADVVPHLDGIDVSVVMSRSVLPDQPGASGAPAATPSPTPTPTPEPSVAGPVVQPQSAQPHLQVDVFGAEVRPDNLASAVASDLVPSGARPLVSDRLPLPSLEAGGAARVDTGFLLGGVDRWSPARPALYVLRVSIDDGSGISDELWTTFGLRHVTVNPETGQLLLNGAPKMFTGVGLHDERIDPEGEDERSSAARVTSVGDLLDQLDHAASVNADLIRTGHTPANPMLLMLADRLGFAVWEEIPLYHYTPLTYGIAMGRGIPQQMLREMALRDMNRASVLFHGLSNESTGTDERESALQTLADIDREIDGTRLTGQAAYGSMPDDPTHGPLDVAGFTFYYDVFYGTDAAADTASALSVAHRANPGKPVIALEFGRWADGADGHQRQARVLADTYPEVLRRSAARGGFVGAAVWWTLEDFTTMVPGIGIEHFGLFEPSGRPRPAAGVAMDLFTAAGGAGDLQQIESDVGRAEVVRQVSAPDLRLLGYLAYGVGLSVALLSVLLFLLVRRGGRAAPRA